jgi:hypothetical protein
VRPWKRIKADFEPCPRPDDARGSVEHLFFERSSRHLFRLLWYGQHSLAYTGRRPYHPLSPRASSSVLSPTAFTRPVWCTHARRLACTLGGLGFGDPRYDSLGNVAPEADRSEAQMSILYRTHSYVSPGSGAHQAPRCELDTDVNSHAASWTC